MIVTLALGAVGARADSCPNVAFRDGASASLPDCRAYELVTPPFKFGSYTKSASIEFLDESHLKVASVGAFAEAGQNNSPSGANYVLGRNQTSGWSATAVDLPMSQFQGPTGFATGEQVADVSRDFGKALVANVPNGTPLVDLRLYLREASGSPSGSCSSGATPLPRGACAVEVGPTEPPATVSRWTPSPFNHNSEKPNVAYVGASPDLTHVLVSNRGAPEGGAGTNWLWPGDTTVAEGSLYEYAGIGVREPKLVGVSNNGRLASDTEANLISQCGTSLGSRRSEDAEHAISNDGATVFFTPAPGGCSAGEVTGTGPVAAELYARLGGARTVAISEPAKEDCTQCDTSSPSEAIFQGASADGSKAFFLSEQTNLLPGAKGMNLYEYDFDRPLGERLLRVSGGQAQPEVRGVTRVSPAGTRVYFVAGAVLASNQDAKAEKATPGGNNLYVYEPDPTSLGQFKTVFIATLSSQDRRFDWKVGGNRRAEATSATQTANDGRFLLFSSASSLTPDAEGAGLQLYRYDAQEEKLVRVSIGQRSPGGYECAATKTIKEGFNCDGNTGDEMKLSQTSLNLGGERAGPLGVSISDDGSYVFFESQAGLTPQALDDEQVGTTTGKPCTEEEEEFETCQKQFAMNVYEYHEGQVYLLSAPDRQAGSTGVTLIGASHSGRDVFFRTSDQLVPMDSDTQQDVYDARIDGGFPAPAAVVSCEGEHCQGALSGSPLEPTPGSATFYGPGNPTPPAVNEQRKPTPKPKPLTRAQRLAKALNACKKKPKRQRAGCVAQAQRRYGRKPSTQHRNRRGK
jgi:hypothetical protein